MDGARTDSSNPVTLTVIDLAPSDLAGAMLRRSLSRPPNRSLFVRPVRAVLLAVATGGLWPGGFLIRRLWQYASHQQFRIGELRAWLSAGKEWPDPRPNRSVRPIGWIAAAAVVWATALLLGVATVVALITDGRATPPLRGAFPMAVAAASMLQVIAILTLRLRVEQTLRVLNRDAPTLRLRPVDSRLPAWTLWPILLALPWMLLWAWGWRDACGWLAGVPVAMLAAEVQRGYITVTDRRLRYALARRVGVLLREAPSSR